MPVWVREPRGFACSGALSSVTSLSRSILSNAIIVGRLVVKFRECPQLSELRCLLVSACVCSAYKKILSPSIHLCLHLHFITHAHNQPQNSMATTSATEPSSWGHWLFEGKLSQTLLN